ncbi:MAG: hypothetical protein EA426_02025 [Spirochaetaceae bacterium]|nr:MAG: hypothetical protein EA426_02025 [Spirochaetaceae bacterium]
MTIEDISRIIGGRIVAAPTTSRELTYGFASDLMSDVLTLTAENVVLVTGLVSNQTIRTAAMADIPAVVLVRNKKATRDIVKLAEDSDIALIECNTSMFKAAGMLYEAGLKAVY